MTYSRRAVLGMLSAPPILALTGMPALAASPQTFQNDGIAIGGIDTVAYFTDGAPVLGKPELQVMCQGANWLFASEENRETFEMNARKYCAVFGGYCAYAASKGYLAPTVPEAWTVYQGRLYLNFSLRARELWRQDIPGNIAKADANWPAILG